MTWASGSHPEPDGVGQRASMSAQRSPSASPGWSSHRRTVGDRGIDPDGRGDDLGRLDGPGHQRRVERTHRAELAPLQPASQRRRLAATQVGEAPAGVVAGEEPLGLGDGLAVADQDESGDGHGPSVGAGRGVRTRVTLRPMGILTAIVAGGLTWVTPVLADATALPQTGRAIPLLAAGVAIGVALLLRIGGWKLRAGDNRTHPTQPAPDDQADPPDPTPRALKTRNGRPGGRPFGNC